MNDLLSVIKIRDQLTLTVEKDDGYIDLKTSVIEINQKEELFKVYNPIYKNRVQTMVIDKKYKFRYIDDKSGIYTFDGRIVERTKDNQIYVLVVKFEGNVKKSQRRAFFRMDIIKKIKINLPMDEGIDTAEKLEKLKNQVQFYPKEILLKDISGGGFGFLTNHTFAVGDIFLAEVNLDEKIIEVIGKVVRKNTVSDNQNDYKYSIGVEFKCLDTKTRRDIINYIFNKQRELRKKGLI
jgi:c-di-GMP-binding flagellar brake protein YcgR